MIVSRANQRVILTPHIQRYPDLYYISTSCDFVLEYLGWVPMVMYQYSKEWDHRGDKRSAKVYLV